MVGKIEVLEQIYNCIIKNQNFVLQGGAGSGKTESLKQVIQHIANKYPEKKIACITHTNLAVDEIKSRIENDYTICTIHSFLNNLIKDYKKNLHEVISEIFKLKKIDGAEHNDYKKKYKEYASTLYTVNRGTIAKVIGKREYDKKKIEYIAKLNLAIKNLNNEIELKIKAKDYNQVRYNETKFDSFNDLSFGHDSLLKMASLLFKKYPLLSKILQSKYDFIFVDEYQDTNKLVIDIFLNKIMIDSNTIIGLFGDSMQSIYDSGIGDVVDYIKSGLLVKIEKEDNYRCSTQVIDFINQFRNDDLKQKVAFKTKNGVIETIDDRQGEVKLYYSVYDAERNSNGNFVDKNAYLKFLNKVVNKVDKQNKNFKKLILTNKSIANEVGFTNLYSVYNERYADVKEEIHKDLERLQLLDLAELSKAYFLKNFNFVISELKKNGFFLSSIEDKKKINSVLGEIFVKDYGAIELLELAFKYKILKKTDSYISYLYRKDAFLDELRNDEFYSDFKSKYINGINTFTKMAKITQDLEEQKFNEYKRLYKKETFYNDLFSRKIKFIEIVNYFSYLNDETNYITMHKTKGSGINNVMVVLDEYFWSAYNFKTIFDSGSEGSKKLRNLKLFYVACSRAIDNLICIKIIDPDEKESILKYFTNYEEVLL